MIEDSIQLAFQSLALQINEICWKSKQSWLNSGAQNEPALINIPPYTKSYKYCKNELWCCFWAIKSTYCNFWYTVLQTMYKMLQLFAFVSQCPDIFCKFTLKKENKDYKGELTLEIDERFTLNWTALKLKNLKQRCLFK